MNKSITVISLLLLCFSFEFLAAKGFCWKDEQGAMVCSDKMPIDGRAVTAMPAATKPADSPVEAQRKLEQQIQQLNERNEQRLKEKEIAAKTTAATNHNKQQCNSARANLDVITNRPPQTMFKMGNGEYRRFTPQERDQQINKANAAIEKFCK